MKRMKLMGMGAAVMTVAASGAQGLPSYSVVEVGGVPVGGHISIHGLNDRGELLVMHVVPGPLVIQAAVWDQVNGYRFLDGDTPYTFARDINDHGQVIGDHSWIWEPDGSMTALPPDLWLQQINNTGQLFGIGWNPVNFETYPVIYESGQAIRVPAPPRDEYLIKDANDSGVAVGGWSETIGFDDDGHAIVDGQGFRMTISGLTELSPLSGAKYSSPVAINHSGMIVGTSVFADSPPRATVWMPDGKMIDLGEGMTIHDVNDLGQAIGYSDSGPFLWSVEEGIEMLPIPGGSPEFVYALGINNLGQIAMRDSTDYTDRAYLLTPIPAPGAAVIALAGVCLCVSRRRRS